MEHYPRCRVLAIIGSGETSPTMVTVHRDLVARLDLSSPQATVLATPYAFQENAADVSARTERYFAESVGRPVDVQVQLAPGLLPSLPPLAEAAQQIRCAGRPVRQRLYRPRGPHCHR